MKKFTGILLAIIMVACLLLVPTYAEPTNMPDDEPAVEVSATSGDWTYNVSGENATITGYSGSDAVVKIPAQIGGYTVKSIKGRSSSKSIFANPEQITEIIIPEGITSIDNYAFTRCESITSVTIPESVTSIGSYAFYRCSALDSVELPNALETIGSRAFYSCNALTEFSIPASVTSIGTPVISGSDLREISVDANNTAYCSVDGVLYNKDKTNLMFYPAAKESAEYRIPDTVKTLDEYAIVSTYNLREMYIPSSLTEVNGNNNFYQCRALENFYVDKNNTVYTDIDGVLYNKAVTKLLSRPAKNPNTEFVIPDTVTAVEQYGLFDLRNLTSLTIPSNVTSISSRSFGYICDDLKDIYYGGTSENWDRLWSFTMPYTEYFPNAEVHYDVDIKPSASPSPSPSASTSPSPSASTTPSPSPSASTSPSPSASTSPSPSPSPTRDPYKWTVLSFTEEYRRVFTSVGKNVEKGTPFTIIAAKYNGDELIDVVVDNFKTTEESGIGQSFTLSKDITPNEDGEYVKIMLWENTTSCKPLGDPYIGDIKVAAFPGAEGAGKYAKGARANQNIEVYHVTNLNDSGEGSFRDAVSERGRIVVFDVGGTINLTKSVDISGNVTILGQTAPGDGITITGANVGAGLYENIIRYLRIRPTFINGLECDAFGGQLQDGIIDHCSTSYSIDECLTFYSNKNVTVQNCISSESLRNAGHQKGNHGYGGIWGGTNSSYHHNLMATHDSRAPRLDRQLQGTDVRNNIIYNWGETNSAYGGESVATDGSYNERDTKVNWVNNYYKAGAATASRLRTRLFDASSPKEYPSYFYMKGNVLEGNAEITNDNTKGVRINSDKGMVFLDEPVEMTYNIPEETAEETYATLLSHVGASLPRRDETDARVINDVINGTGRIIDNASEVGGVMQYEPVCRTFEIPKEWKEANGMGDSAESDVVTYGKWMGYTWIEAYVNDWTEQQSNPTNPTVKLNVGASRVNVGEAFSVSAEAEAQSGTEITQIDIYDNDVRIGTYTGASAAADIKINAAGIHYISAVVYNDKDEGTRSTPIAVNVVE